MADKKIFKLDSGQKNWDRVVDLETSYYLQLVKWLRHVCMPFVVIRLGCLRSWPCTDTSRP